MSTQTPDKKEKIGTVLCYLTFGIWGVIWLLISRIPSYYQKDFIRFHCFQSILIGMFYMFIPQGISILFSLLSQIVSFIPNTQIIIDGLSNLNYLLQKLIEWGGIFLITYCVVFCCLGKFTNIPWISRLVNRMLR